MAGSVVLARVFGAHAVHTAGAILPSYEARGTFGGLRVRVELAWSNTRRSTKRFTTIDIEEDLDVALYTGGAHWPYPEWEAFSVFTSERLAEKAAAGAPRALLSKITHGPIADRLAMTGIVKLTAGSQAKREGCATRGVRLVVAEWPNDAGLRFLIDTALAIATEARREVAAGIGWRGAQSGGRHPEVVADEVARAASRAKGLKVVAGIFAGLSAASAIIAALLIGAMR